jgi:hypothetical protein
LSPLIRTRRRGRRRSGRRPRTEHAGLSRAGASALLRETLPGAAGSHVFDAGPACLEPEEPEFLAFVAKKAFEP